MDIKSKPTTSVKYLSLYLFLTFMLLGSAATAGEKFTINTTLAYNTGKYIYDARINDYILYLGAYYKKDRFSISTTLPLVLERDKRSDGQETSTFGFGSQKDIKNSPVYASGLSDLYIYAEYEFYRSQSILPRAFITGQVKVPTTTKSTLFSSGKFDYSVGMSFRKMYGTFKLFADIGYLAIGDPEGINYSNPFFYGIGIGKHAPDGRSSVTFYYQEYGEIIPGLTPPRQLTTGYFRAITNIIGISFYGSKGFGESSPEYSFAVGLDLKI